MKVILNEKVFIVKWSHPTYEHWGPKAISVRGTECAIKHDDHSIMGQAICSIKERFCKDKGRKVSLAHALKKTAFGKSERKVFWDEYLKQKPNKEV